MWPNITRIRTQTAAVIGQFIDDTNDNDIDSVVVLYDADMAEVVSEMKHDRHQEITSHVG